MKIVISFYFFLFSALLSAQQSNTLKIGDFQIECPDWWEEITVSLPDSINDSDKARIYITNTVGSDVGDSTTWKLAIKSWFYYYKRVNSVAPLYIGHCFLAGKQTNEALSVYMKIYYTVESYEHKNWYKCYAAFNVGLIYKEQQETKLAKKWFRNASKNKFLRDSYDGTRYYAAKAKKMSSN